MFGDNRYVLAARTMIRSMSKTFSARLYYVDFIPDSLSEGLVWYTSRSDGYFLWR